LCRDSTDHTLLVVDVEVNAQGVVFRLLEGIVGQDVDDDAVFLVGDAGDEFN
jgi:hypothetical protein